MKFESDPERMHRADITFRFGHKILPVGESRTLLVAVFSVDIDSALEGVDEIISEIQEQLEEDTLAQEDKGILSMEAYSSIEYLAKTLVGGESLEDQPIACNFPQSAWITRVAFAVSHQFGDDAWVREVTVDDLYQIQQSSLTPSKLDVMRGAVPTLLPNIKPIRAAFSIDDDNLSNLLVVLPIFD